MSCVRLLLVLLFVCGSLRADTVILQGGKAWYLADGATIAVRVDKVIRLGGDGPVDPPTDPPTDPPNENELTLLSSAWESKVAPYKKRDSHRQGLQATYSVLGARAAAGSLDLGELKDREEQLAALVLGSDESNWNEWYEPIGVYLGVNVSSVDQVAVAYEQIAAGLEVEGEAIGPGWVKVIEIIIGLLGEGTIPPAMLALIKLFLEILGG